MHINLVYTVQTNKCTCKCTHFFASVRAPFVLATVSLFFLFVRVHSLGIFIEHSISDAQSCGSGRLRAVWPLHRGNVVRRKTTVGTRDGRTTKTSRSNTARCLGQPTAPGRAVPCQRAVAVLYGASIVQPRMTRPSFRPA